MSTFDVIRAWKDEDYRLSLSDAQRSMLPDSPVGLVELSDADMGILTGGTDSCDCCDHGHKGGGSNGRGRGPHSAGGPPGCVKKWK